MNKVTGNKIISDWKRMSKNNLITMKKNLFMNKINTQLINKRNKEDNTMT